MIFVTFLFITPILEEVTPNSTEIFYISGNPREVLKKATGIVIPKSTEILEFEQSDYAWYHFNLKCEMFTGARTLLRENISETYVIGKNQPNEIIDLKVTSVYEIPNYFKSTDWFNVTDENLVCYYFCYGVKSDVKLICKCVPALRGFITNENGKEYIYIET